MKRQMVPITKSQIGEISIHTVPQNENDLNDEQNLPNLRLRFDIPPFRQTFFRYSLYGRSEVVRSSSFVYASHHSSETTWLDIQKLSVVLVGNNEIPDLTLFSPTVKEVHFVGHITYPSTVFRTLAQIHSLKKVVFNFGFGGHCNEFGETADALFQISPLIPSVTSAEIKINHQLYHGCSEETRGVFDKIIDSVLTHSSNSFPNLSEIVIDLPATHPFLERVTNLINSSVNLRDVFEIRTIRNERKIQTLKKAFQQPTNLSFDPCAHFPSTSQYNLLKMVNRTQF